MHKRYLTCNCSGVSVAEACGIVMQSNGEAGARQLSLNTTSEAVRRLLLGIKAETEENRICADCRRVGKSEKPQEKISNNDLLCEIF